MLRARLEISHKLKKTLGEVGAMPTSELMLHLAFLMVKADERKKAMKKR